MRDGLSALPRASRVFVERLLEKEHISITRFIRNTQRFYVAKADYRGHKALFKVCVHPKSRDPWTNRKFSKEILFLQFLAKAKGHRIARRLAPQIHAGGVESRAWYVREYIEGDTYNIADGNIRYRDSFFTSATRKEVVAAFHDLQSIQKWEVPEELVRRLKRYDQTSYVRKLLNPWWGRIARFLGDRAAAKDIPSILESRRNVFDAAAPVLTHQEPYAAHFIRMNGRLRMIDWENIAWANPLHDYTNIWMRADKHPAWQRALKEDARRTTKRVLGDSFECVWHNSIFIKCLFNVLSFPYYKDKKDFRQLHAFSRTLAAKQLRAWRAQ